MKLLLYRRYCGGALVGDEDIGQVEGAAEHDEGDAVRAGGGHGEEVPEALPLQRLPLLQLLLPRHLRLHPVAALALEAVVPADSADERTDAPRVVRVSREWRREQVGRAMGACRSRGGC